MAELPHIVYKRSMKAGFLWVTGISGLFAAVFLIAVLANGLVASTSAWLVVVVGFLIYYLAFLGLVSLILGLQRANELRQIKQFLAGELWASWQYTAEEWRNFNDLRFAGILDRTKPAQPLTYSIVVGIVVTIVLVIVALVGVSADLKPILLLIAGITLVIVVGSGVLSAMNMRASVRRQYDKQMRIKAPRVFLGADAVYHEIDGYFSLRRLVSGEYFPHKIPPEIVLRAWQQVGGGRNRSTVLLSESIPVPHGHEDEGATLVQRYQQQVAG